MYAGIKESGGLVDGSQGDKICDAGGDVRVSSRPPAERTNKKAHT